jgi:hypothetical protein
MNRMHSKKPIQSRNQNPNKMKIPGLEHCNTIEKNQVGVLMLLENLSELMNAMVGNQNMNKKYIPSRSIILQIENLI